MAIRRMWKPGGEVSATHRQRHCASSSHLRAARAGTDGWGRWRATVAARSVAELPRSPPADHRRRRRRRRCRCAPRGCPTAAPRARHGRCSERRRRTTPAAVAGLSTHTRSPAGTQADTHLCFALAGLVQPHRPWKAQRDPHARVLVLCTGQQSRPGTCLAHARAHLAGGVHAQRLRLRHQLKRACLLRALTLRSAAARARVASRSQPARTSSHLYTTPRRNCMPVSAPAASSSTDICERARHGCVRRG